MSTDDADQGTWLLLKKLREARNESRGGVKHQVHEEHEGQGREKPLMKATDGRIGRGQDDNA
jgi:hypothetical protein